MRDVLRAPPGQIALDYALIGDTLLVWVIDGETIRLTRTHVDRAGLSRAIDRVRSSLELRTSDAAVRPELAALYDWLIRPLREQLGPPGTPLVLIADGEIAGVPLAALLDTARGRYLVEDHSLRFASTLSSALRTERAAGRHERTAVLVADPAFSPAAFRGLDRLPGARREVEAIAAEYPRATIIAGAAADRAALDTAFRKGGVVHFAGHAVFDDERPERSFLVLAPPRDRHGSDRLSAVDVERLDLRRLHLVVLSACQTSLARSGRSGGYAGLVGALLGAGAGGVVGSLWRVDDRLTEALMIEFHRSYLDLGNGAAALRAAQLRLLRSPDPALHSPAAWAAFRYTGA
jgi:CHAT domain-containing protein